MPASLLLILATAIGTSPNVIVVCPDAFIQSLQPWVEHRTSEGYEIAYVSNLGTPAEIRSKLRKIANRSKIHSIVLIGDADPAAATNAQLRSHSVPTHHEPARVNIRWGSESEIATDNWFADLDDDRIPDVAIGRLPADTPAELTTLIHNILRYERSADFGAWRKKINFVAGSGGFGMLADMMIETAAKKFITDGIPAEYDTSMTYGNWHSPFCPNPIEFQHIVLGRLNEGCLVWAYLGHGHRTRLDVIRTPAGYAPILEPAAFQQNKPHTAAPIVILLACYTGTFDGPDDCLAENMLRAEGGPAAVICGSRVAMPYGMAVFGTSLLDEFFRQRRTTLGEIVLYSKRRLAAHGSSDRQRDLLDSLAKTISPAPDQLAAERTEHASLFNLLGDPLLTIRRPKKIDLEVPRYIQSGTTLQVTGNSPLGGELILELVCRRDRFRFSTSPRHRFKMTPQALRWMNRVYHEANNTRWTTIRLKIPPGAFETSFDVPEAARGPCHVRGFVSGITDFAMGATDVYVRPKSQIAESQPSEKVRK